MVKFSTGEASEEFTSPKRVKLSDCEGPSQAPNMGNNPYYFREVAAAAAGSDGKALIATIDPDAFDCSICMEPLSPPIFQCSNGHIACSSCCVLMDNKCHSCLRPIAKIRCLAIEKLIESMKVGCRYARNGCRELIRCNRCCWRILRDLLVEKEGAVKVPKDSRCTQRSTVQSCQLSAEKWLHEKKLIA